MGILPCRLNMCSGQNSYMVSWHCPHRELTVTTPTSLSLHYLLSIFNPDTPLRRGCAAARLLGLRVRNLSVVFCQVEFSASERSLLQRSPTECGVSECDHEAP